MMIQNVTLNVNHCKVYI